tara:strand:+ start:3372 stop:3743 length:372 start_codon:yes stop_codon:yes gene_type:complete
MDTFPRAVPPDATGGVHFKIWPNYQPYFWQFLTTAYDDNVGHYEQFYNLFANANDPALQMAWLAGAVNVLYTMLEQLRFALYVQSGFQKANEEGFEGVTSAEHWMKTFFDAASSIPHTGYPPA